MSFSPSYRHNLFTFVIFISCGEGLALSKSNILLKEKSTDQYCLLLNQYHRISTSTAPYWSSTTKYQSIPTYTDPVPSYINQYCLLLTQYHQVSTRTNLYCCWLGITDSCTVYPGSCHFGHWKCWNREWGKGHSHLLKLPFPHSRFGQPHLSVFNFYIYFPMDFSS